MSKIFGVRIRLHYTWFAATILIIAAVVTQFPTAYPLWQRIMLGLAACVLFLVALTIRELVVSFTATSKGIPVKSITLFVFGGVSEIAKESTRPVLELLLAVVGVLSNLIIAGRCFLS